MKQGGAEGGGAAASSIAATSGAQSLRQIPGRIARERQHQRRDDFLAERFQAHGCLAFVARMKAYADQRAGSVEEATDRRRGGRVQVRCRRHCAAGSRPGARRPARDSGLPADRQRRAPGLARRTFAARQAKRPEARGVLPGTGSAQYRLATPQCIVRTQANTVPSEAQDRRLARILSGDRGSVGKMMPNRLRRQTRVAGPTAVGKAGMRVVDNALSTYAVELLQIASNLRENLAAARAREVADMGRHDEAISPRQRHGGFHIGTDREGGDRDGLRQVKFERRGSAPQPQRPWDACSTRKTGSSAGRAMVRS